MHPLWDATYSICQQRRQQYYFNSCIPYGMQPSSRIALRSSSVFQFMHPLWDATYGFDFLYDINDISIHASLMGCNDDMPAVVRSLAISIHASFMGCNRKI